MFSVPDMPVRCAQAEKVTRLRATTRTVQLRVGRLFPLSTLKVVALESSGSVVPQVPVAVEVEDVSPSILDFPSDHLQFGPVPIRPGNFKFRVRTICEGTGAEIMVKAHVAG